MMPKVAGIEVLKRLRGNQRTHGIKVMIVTDLPVRGDDFAAELADQLLVTPTGRDEIVPALARLIG